ncbi:MAG: hypothetical protein LBB34_01740 [Holosporales bacterium]|jgi:hypothetical protein|nr:hypothetical protein [Holosporales bacterium]
MLYSQQRNSSNGVRLAAPWNLDALRESLQEGRLIADTYMNFGAKSKGDRLSTGINVDIEEAGEFNGNEVIPVYRVYGTSYVDTWMDGVGNRLGCGKAGLSPVHIASTNGSYIAELIQAQYCGARDEFTLLHTQFMGSDPNNNKQCVICALKFSSCQVIAVSLDTYPIAHFVFSPVALEIHTMNYKQHSKEGINEFDGKKVYRIDTNLGSASRKE